MKFTRPAYLRGARGLALCGLVAVAGTTAAGLLATGPDPKVEPKKPDARKVNGAAPRAADQAVARIAPFEVTTTANGDLQARKQIELRSKLERQSTIQFIIAEGTRVKAGELLCQLNSDQIQDEIDQVAPQVVSARANFAGAEANYLIQVTDNESAMRKAELTLQLAELALNQWRLGDAVKKRQELSLKIDAAELELERLAEKLRRSQDLLAEGFLSRDEADQDEVAYIRAISEYTTSRLDREVYESYEYSKEEKQKYSDVEEARAEKKRVELNNESQLKSKEAARENQRQQVALFENRERKLREQLESCKMTAPQDGLVVYASSVDSMRWGMGGGDQPLQIGRQVHPNELLIALPDTSEMIAAVRIHESLSGRIHEGLEVDVKVDAAGGRVFRGTVESIGVMAESGGWRDPNLREYTVKIGLDTEGFTGLKPAMRVESRIVLERVEDTLGVPVQALFSEGVVQYVFTPRGSKFERVPVKVGRRSDTVAEIRAGIDAGATVLLRQPTPGETLTQPWAEEKLALAGYKRDAEGNITSTEGNGNGRRGGGPGGRGMGGREAKPMKVARPEGEKAEGAEKPAETAEAKKADDGPSQ